MSLIKRKPSAAENKPQLLKIGLHHRDKAQAEPKIGSSLQPFILNLSGLWLNEFGPYCVYGPSIKRLTIFKERPAAAMQNIDF